jgi:methyl-accepting chemotaxis protein
VPLALKQGDTVELALMKPEGTLEQYEHQCPSKFRARIAWAKEVEDGCLYGIEFSDLTAKCRSTLEECFAFFHTDPQFVPA